MLIFVLILSLVIDMCRGVGNEEERKGKWDSLPFDSFKLPLCKREVTVAQIQKHLETRPKCQID